MVGQPWEWQPFQESFIRKLFPRDRHVRRGILSIGRRGGKTGTAAMLVLAGLYGPLAVRNSLILSASMSREQAAIVFGYAKKMALLSGLAEGLKIRDHSKEIECTGTGVLYRAISADASRAAATPSSSPRTVRWGWLGPGSYAPT